MDSVFWKSREGIFNRFPKGNLQKGERFRGEGGRYKQILHTYIGINILADYDVKNSPGWEPGI